jgi:hypothetical protein
MRRDLAFSVAAGFAGLVCAISAAAQPRSYVEAAASPGTPAAVNPNPNIVPGNLGGLSIFTDRTTFENANPGLVSEDFEAGNAPSGGFSVCDAPLSAAGDATCGFAPGAIAAGVTFQDNPGPDAGALILLGATTSLNPTQALVSNTFADSFDMLFNPPVNAAGMDLHSTPAPGSGPPDVLTIQVFDASGALLGTDAMAAASGPGNFWGVTSTTPIGRISLLSNNNQAEGVDNLGFGSGFPEPGIPVPTLDRVGLLVLLGLAAASGLLLIRRKG